MIFQDCSEMELKQRSKEFNIICFGASSMFQRVASSLDLCDKIIGLIDNDEKKWGTSVFVGADEYVVYSPELLKNNAADQYVILITSIYYTEIKRQLDGIKELENKDLYIYPLTLQYYPANNSDDFLKKRIVSPSLIKLKEVFDIQGLAENEQQARLMEKEKFALREDTVVLPQVTFVITNKCTLQCKHCNMLIPYVKKDFFVTLEDSKAQVTQFLAGVDEIFLFSLIGGEVMLHPQFDKILEFVLNQEKIYRVMVTINATIIPTESVVKLLKNRKVIVYISDYRIQDENILKIKDLFTQHDIKFAVKTDWQWVDFGDATNRNKDQDLLKYEYLQCLVSTFCRTLYNNKFFVCTRAAIMQEHHIGKYSAENEYIDLKDYNSPEALREKIKAFILLESAEACNYCEGSIAKPEFIIAGEQLTIVKKE